MIQNMNEVARRESVRLRKIDNSYYIADTVKCYEANNLGAIVFKYIGQDIKIDELCNKVADKFNFHDLKVIKSDVLNYIEFLVKEGLVDKIAQ